MRGVVPVSASAQSGSALRTSKWMMEASWPVRQARRRAERPILVLAAPRWPVLALASSILINLP
eukprot:CAMPEP_0184552730 /NCGR_PEP_ID=MMETSP0199_2-20130426/29845_1 /TAXON_ID=1112570 /ORGANISM="Thraustochytrium sp., Strain LLF1b" /LENGTH=63 /DNA_ID=CAMNT_0026948287 /DNA_START=110 /DNA_END=297 /DNA_ORIENTATION=+